MDACLFKFTSYPISAEEIKKQKEKRGALEGSGTRMGISLNFLAIWIRTGGSRTTFPVTD